MLIELSYILFGVLLIVYAAWMFLRRKERHMLFLTLAFTFLELSILLQILESAWWVYIYQFDIDPLFLKIGGLAFFAIFTVTAVVALREKSKGS